MFCIKCGSKLNDGDKFCTYCGSAVEVAKQENDVTAVVEEVAKEVVVESSAQPEEPVRKKIHGLGLAGFIVSVASFIFSGTPLLIPSLIVGLILSAVAMKKFNKEKHKLKGFAIAGLVISIVALSIFLFAIMIVACSAVILAL